MLAESPPAFSASGEVFTVHSGRTGTDSARLVGCHRRPSLLSPGIKARYGSTQFDNLKTIQDIYNSGACCQERPVVGKEEERGREERQKGFQLAPHLKAAFSISSVKYLSAYHRSGNISPYIVT